MTALPDPAGCARRRYTRTALAGHGLTSATQTSRAQYQALRTLLGFSGRPPRRSRDLMDRYERADVDPDTLAAMEPVDADDRLDALRAARALEGLDLRRLEVVRRRLCGDTLREVASDLDLSSERIRLLEIDAYRWARRALDR